MAEENENIFGDAEDESAVLYQLAGFASVCWEDAPRSRFEYERAAFGVEQALERLDQLRRGQAEGNKKADTTKGE